MYVGRPALSSLRDPKCVSLTASTKQAGAGSTDTLAIVAPKGSIHTFCCKKTQFEILKSGKKHQKNSKISRKAAKAP